MPPSRYLSPPSGVVFQPPAVIVVVFAGKKPSWELRAWRWQREDGDWRATGGGGTGTGRVGGWRRMRNINIMCSGCWRQFWQPWLHFLTPSSAFSTQHSAFSIQHSASSCQYHMPHPQSCPCTRCVYLYKDDDLLFTSSTPALTCHSADHSRQYVLPAPYQYQYVVCWSTEFGLIIITISLSIWPCKSCHNLPGFGRSGAAMILRSTFGVRILLVAVYDACHITPKNQD
jgi:hypothetical protein